MTAGVLACLAALAVATATGLLWRARNGKMRASRSSRSLTVVSGPAVFDSPEPELAVSPPAELASDTPAPAALTTAQLGQPLGERATLLQFSSAFCAPCRATRRVLADVAGLTPGVTHIEIDAESHLDLVRALGVLRTPTVFVLAADGRIVRRASGQPRKADVIGALGAAVDAGAPTGEFSYSPGQESR